MEEIITPAGKVSSGHWGQGASLVPPYLDGERNFLEKRILKYGDSVRENISMDYDLPGLAEAVKTKDVKNARYDLIEQTIEDDGYTTTYWFNRETGMLDFVIR